MILARRLAAFVVAPLIGGIVFYLVWILWEGGHALAAFIPFFWLPFAIGLIAEVVFGLPIVMWLRRKKRLSHAVFAIGGLGVGVLISLIVRVDPFAGAISLVGVTACLLSAVVGSVAFGYVGGWSSNEPLERTGSAGRSAQRSTARRQRGQNFLR